jgi:hypothetical protein
MVQTVLLIARSKATMPSAFTRMVPMPLNVAKRGLVPLPPALPNTPPTATPAGNPTCDQTVVFQVANRDGLASLLETKHPPINGQGPSGFLCGIQVH